MGKFKRVISLLVLAVFSVTLLGQGMAALLSCDCSSDSHCEGEHCGCYDSLNGHNELQFRAECDCCVDLPYSNSFSFVESPYKHKVSKTTVLHLDLFAFSTILPLGDDSQLGDLPFINDPPTPIRHIYLNSKALRAPPIYS